MKPFLLEQKIKSSEGISHSTKLNDGLQWKPVWHIMRFDNDEDYQGWLKGEEVIYDNPEKLFGGAPQTSEIDGNLLLNDGITEALKLMAGLTATAFSNANSYIGVGDSDTAESASQTGLQASTNKLWKAMDTSYPSVASQTITYQATFGSSDANYAWKEFTIVNASSDTGTNLNRKVSDQGTKTAGQTWVIQIAITMS